MAMAGEHFDYEGVKNVMDQKISGANEKAVQTFNDGANEIENSLGAVSGGALSGAAGATAKNTWTTLTEEYQKFSNYIQAMVDEANELGKQVAETENTITSDLTSVDNNASGVVKK